MDVKTRILKTNVNVTRVSEVVDKVFELVQRATGGYVCVCNVHMCMESWDSEEFQEIVNNAEIVVADGKPLSLIQKFLGHSDAEQVRGEDLMKRICDQSTTAGVKVGFYGGRTPDVLASVREKLRCENKELNIGFSHSPRFFALGAAEDEKIIEDIVLSGIDVLFVGVGCPKQEVWMAQHRKQLPCVMLGVGAAFDFISGGKQRAPKWMQNLCLEWLFRLIEEPGRLAKRYILQNSRFLGLLTMQALLAVVKR